MEHPKNCPPVGSYLRNKNTGDLAQVVIHEGAVKIKPDLPGSPVYYPGAQAYNWVLEPKAKQLPPGAFARIAYEADRALCEIHPELKRQPEWLSLDTNKRAAWIEARIKMDNPLRLELYNAIMVALNKHSG